MASRFFPGQATSLHWCVSGPEGGKARPGKQGHLLGLRSEHVGLAWCLQSPMAGQGLAVWLEEQGRGGLWTGPGYC